MICSFAKRLDANHPAPCFHNLRDVLFNSDLAVLPCLADEK